MNSYDKLIKRIRKYAETNYDKRGWDNIVEATTDEEIIENYLTRDDGSYITDFHEAINIMDKELNEYEDYTDEIKATEF